MKQGLLILLLIASFAASAQSGYVPRNTSEKLYRHADDSTTHVPAGVSPSLRGGWPRSGAIFVDTVGGGRGLWFYALGAWYHVLDSAAISSAVTPGGNTHNIQLNRNGALYGSDSLIMNATGFQLKGAQFIDSGRLVVRGKWNSASDSAFMVSRGGAVTFRVDNAGGVVYAAGLDAGSGMFTVDGMTARVKGSSTSMSFETGAYIKSFQQELNYIKNYPILNPPYSGFVISNDTLGAHGTPNDTAKYNPFVVKFKSYSDGVERTKFFVNQSGYIWSQSYPSGSGGSTDSAVVIKNGVLSSVPYSTIGSGGSGTDNTNTGSGYRWLKPTGQSIKTAFNGIGILIDSSSNTDGLTFKSDTLVNQTWSRGMKIVDSMKVVNDSRYWSLSGNAGTAGSQAGSWFGTNNSVALRIRTNNTQRAYWDSTKAQLNIGSPTIDNANALNVQGLSNNTFEGIKIWANNLSADAIMAWNGFRTTGAMSITANSSNITLNTLSSAGVGVNQASPTAQLHVGASTTSRAGLRLNSTGSLPTSTNILAGNIDAIGDKIYYTIATGPAQKEIVLANSTLTANTYPIATTGGQIVNSSFTTSNLRSATQLNPSSFTTIANLDAASAVTSSMNYTQVGNVVTFSIQITVDPTLTATSTTLRFAPPVASAFTASTQASGTATCATVAGMTGVITADAANDQLLLTFISTDINSQTFIITGQYEVL